MAKESPLGTSFLKGLGALVAALLLFAGEQYIQHRYWQDPPPSHDGGSTTTTNNTSIPIAGRVVDAAGTTAIENAVVQLTVGLIHENQNTDSEGRYAFSLQGFDPNTAASMSIDAQGYKHLSMNLLLNAMEQDKELRLVAQGQTSPGNAGIGAIAGAAYVGHLHVTPSGAVAPASMVQYIRRANPKLIVAH